MSRLGKYPIPLPDKVTVHLDGSGSSVEVSGPLGKLSRTIPTGIVVKSDGKQLLLTRADDSLSLRQKHGLARALVKNMVDGVTSGFEKNLEIHGVGYRATLTGDKLSLQLGFSHIIDYQVPQGIKIKVDKQTLLQITGFDRELVGSVAAQIRHFREPEPYQGKGIRYAGEHIIKKAGKTAAGAGAGGAIGGGGKK